MTATVPITTAAARDRRGITVPVWIITLVAVVIVLAAWQLATVIFGINPSLLPSPIRIVAEADWGVVAGAAGATLISTALGFVAGNTLGLVLAIVICGSRTAADIVYPGAIFVRAIPIVALAPFITLALGRGVGATVAVAALIVFFPTLVNTILGLRSVPREALELMHVTNASPLFTYLAVRVPFALPSFASALRISAPNAVLGVMTAEWIIGGDGLGRLIVQAWLRLDIATMWGAVLVSAALAWALFSLLGVLERALLGWAVRT